MSETAAAPPMTSSPSSSPPRSRTYRKIPEEAWPTICRVMALRQAADELMATLGFPPGIVDPKNGVIWLEDEGKDNGAEPVERTS